ncbi:hypothetical protein SELMODRAFT_412375 [Selaginella moellendorffii]|uniref:Uncharacterized protein n=1 Tax=Selaginella moellendorffii TaxID=88036 RepID=D8RKY5_SELML|nr:hypothetical protein SELMODRAFT_412375 [Selaginella moellendorffii]
MERGLLWKLPLVKSSEWGKLGPAFGAGVGCGVGVGAGIIGACSVGWMTPLVFYGLSRRPIDYAAYLSLIFLDLSTAWREIFCFLVSYGLGELNELLQSAGLGFGFPGFQFGVGLGAGCGIGVGFGYGLGKGRAYDENGSYSNMGRYSAKRAASSGAEIRAIVDDFVSGMRRALASWESELQKRRRS